MQAPTLDAKASAITIETEAVGMLMKLAHDLSVVARSFSATAAVDGDAVSVTVEVPVDGLQVDGVRKHGAVDRGVLSSSDKADIEEKIRREVLETRAVVVKAKVKPTSPLDAPGSQSIDAELDVEIGRAKDRVRARVTLTSDGKTVTAKGRAPLDLPRFDITPPKGPLGAFRVKDTVNVDFSLVFVAG